MAQLPIMVSCPGHGPLPLPAGIAVRHYRGTPCHFHQRGSPVSADAAFSLFTSADPHGSHPRGTAGKCSPRRGEHPRHGVF
ncbi:hypothetical protein CLV67_104316 [Actinoplanes italicus]|uniref:Uncharacterized protein n=1 Tax=Actinoplanes italicus TaxID=113567 RepID=A0A2T0KH89_9ACTN|nr:hypothetical protein CLV67_104316 [Actinoplanes italicus]